MNRQIRGLVFFGLFFLTSCIPSTIQQQTQILPEKGVWIPPDVQRLAVMPFHDNREDTTEFPNLAAELQKRIINGLVARQINVVERDSLKAILKEKALGQSGIVVSDDIHRLGKLLNVDSILVGEVQDYGKVITPVAKLDLSCRLIDVRTGKILFALQVDARKTNILYPFELHREVIEEAVLQTVKAIRQKK